MNTFVILGGTGGALAALAAVITIGRGIFRQVSATEDNTDALNKLSAKVDTLTGTTNGHETRISVLEAVRREARH